MDNIKRLTTEALQEIEDGKPVEGLILVVAAIEELADALEIVAYPEQYDDVFDIIDIT